MAGLAWLSVWSKVQCFAMHMVQLTLLLPRLLLHENSDSFKLSGASLFSLSWKRGH